MESNKKGALKLKNITILMSFSFKKKNGIFLAGFTKNYNCHTLWCQMISFYNNSSNKRTNIVFFGMICLTC